MFPKLTSPQKLLEALKAKGYDKLKGTSKKELGKYKGDSLITTLLLYKQANTLITMYINGFYEREVKKRGKTVIEPPRFINPITKRVHGNFNQYGTLSGRFSCKNPNLQQLPSRYSGWRHIYTAAPGNKIIAVDYSQIELRIAGQLSKDPKFIQAYKSGLDLHKQTAAKMFNIPLEQVTKQAKRYC